MPDVVAAQLIRGIVNDDLIYSVDAWLPALGVIFALFAAKGFIVYLNNKSTLSLSFDVTCEVQPLNQVIRGPDFGPPWSW